MKKFWNNIKTYLFSRFFIEETATVYGRGPVPETFTLQTSLRDDGLWWSWYKNDSDKICECGSATKYMSRFSAYMTLKNEYITTLDAWENWLHDIE